MPKDKGELICNKLTALEIFLEKMIDRDYISESTRKQTQKVVFATVIFPLLKEIRQSGINMEQGLWARSEIMRHYGIEGEYQSHKPKNHVKQS